MSSLLYLKTLIGYFDTFSLCQGNGNVAKETEATPHRVKAVKAWKDGSFEVFTSFLTNGSMS